MDHKITVAPWLAAVATEQEAAMTTTRYHVGTNVPGYLPDNPPSCHATASEARDALFSALHATAEHIGEECDHWPLNPECEVCVRYNAAHEAATGVLTGGPGWQEGLSIAVNTGRALPLMHWLEPTIMDHAECDANQ